MNGPASAGLTMVISVGIELDLTMSRKVSLLQPFACSSECEPIQTVYIQLMEALREKSSSLLLKSLIT